ncbi:uncharacterized protein LOC114023740 [Vombatus ursinus]|uniref:uncharacterized protein LOC114023740 n=1 Tax=Vombatus ursinus TaxID=29139 RepID=UPI000FFD7C20|nr:uncharacterized protein LOC114023740 [Vombatus ursinus]
MRQCSVSASFCRPAPVEESDRQEGEDGGGSCPPGVFILKQGVPFPLPAQSLPSRSQPFGGPPLPGGVQSPEGSTLPFPPSSFPAGGGGRDPGAGVTASGGRPAVPLPLAPGRRRRRLYGSSEGPEDSTDSEPEPEHEPEPGSPQKLLRKVSTSGQIWHKETSLPSELCPGFWSSKMMKGAPQTDLGGRGRKSLSLHAGTPSCRIGGRSCLPCCPVWHCLCWIEPDWCMCPQGHSEYSENIPVKPRHGAWHIEFKPAFCHCSPLHTPGVEEERKELPCCPGIWRLLKEHASLSLHPRLHLCWLSPLRSRSSRAGPGFSGSWKGPTESRIPLARSVLRESHPIFALPAFFTGRGMGREGEGHGSFL